MADALQNIQGMDGEQRLWRDIGDGAHAETVVIDGTVSIRDAGVAVAATGTIVITDPSHVTPAAEYQEGDTVTLDDGTHTESTFEFYTAGSAVYVGAGNIPVPLGDSPILELEDAINAAEDLDITATAVLNPDGYVLNLANDNAGISGNAPIVAVEEIAGTFVVYGMIGGSETGYDYWTDLFAATARIEALLTRLVAVAEEYWV